MAVLFGVAACIGSAGAQSSASDDRGRVNNTIVIDNKLISNQQVSPSQSGIRLNAIPPSAETEAKEQAIDNRVSGDVRQNGSPVSPVRGTTDNVVDVKNIITNNSSDNSKACVEIGTIGTTDLCKAKSK